MIFTLGGTTLTGAYTAAQYTAGQLPAVGTVYYDVANKKKYIFLKNAGTDPIPASMCAQVTTTMPSTFTCTIGTAQAGQVFAGVRVAGATSLAQNEYGWFQIGGNTILTAGTAGVSASKLVEIGDGANGAVEDVATTGDGGILSAAAAFAYAHGGAADTVTFAATIFKSVWGL